MSATGTTCLNCHQPNEGRFCSRCGQKAETHRFTVGHVLHEVPHNLFHLDKGILRNIRSIFSPQKAVVEFISGRRVSYFSPLLYFFMSLGLILYLETVLGSSSPISVDMTLENSSYDASPFINKYLRYIFFTFAFLVAIPNYWLFKKETGYNYAEQVVASTFILGFVNTAYLVLMWHPAVYMYPVNLFALFLLSVFTFLVYYKGKWWVTLLKTAVAVMLSLLFFTLAIVLLWLIGMVVHNLSH